jgi:hypothetical protein
MQTDTQQGMQGKDVNLDRIDAFSVNKSQTGAALRGASFDGCTVQVQDGISDTAIGKSREDLLQALDQHLVRPFPHPTAFYVLDRLDRLAGESGQYTHLNELAAFAAQPDNDFAFRLGMVLSAALRAGAIEKIGPQNGSEGSYRITNIGKRYLHQAKHMRVALWKINPLRSIGEICAIVQVEGGDTLSEMIASGKDEEAPTPACVHNKKRGGRKASHSAMNTTAVPQMTSRDEGRAMRGVESQPRLASIHPLWAGLTQPLQQQSYTNP